MKSICVHYRMRTACHIPGESEPLNVDSAETCITLSVFDFAADDIMEKQKDSVWVSPYSGTRNVHDVLRDMACLQGYETVEFLMAELS